MGGAKTVIVAGVGFRHRVDADEIVALIGRALREVSQTIDVLSGLATATARAEEPGLLDAARQLGLPVSAIGPEALAATVSRLRTGSARVEALYGVGSVAEAAALACAGEGAELLAARVASARATCALARRRDP